MLHSGLSTELLFCAVSPTPPSLVALPTTNLNSLLCARKTNKQKKRCEFATSEHLVLLICTLLVCSAQNGTRSRINLAARQGGGREGDGRAREGKQRGALQWCCSSPVAL